MGLDIATVCVVLKVGGVVGTGCPCWLAVVEVMCPSIGFVEGEEEVEGDVKCLVGVADEVLICVLLLEWFPVLIWVHISSWPSQWLFGRIYLEGQRVLWGVAK